MPSTSPSFVPWSAAWREALYGPAGFYRRPEGPGGHFRTAAHAAPGQLAAAMWRLAADLGCTGLVDVGAGRGELLTALAAAAPNADRTLWGVDVVPRPARLPAAVGWSTAIADVPARAWEGALVMAWELLDVVPCTVLEVDDGRLRQVLVDPATGRESLGDLAEPAVAAWCERWWPLNPAAPDGDRVEVGATRDRFWAGLVEVGMGTGAAAFLAVDYAHDRSARPAAGSLTGYRGGRAVPPRPDGSMDVTAHVALDCVAAAGDALGVRTLHRSTQSEELRSLGVRDAELLDPGALGGFGWLLQSPRDGLDGCPPHHGDVQAKDSSHPDRDMAMNTSA